jgi:hypothetical protein
MTLNAVCEGAPSAEQAYWRIDEALAGFMACETHRYKGAFFVGASTFEAIETLLSTAILYSERFGWASPLSHAWWAEAAARLARLGSHPDVAKGQRNFEGERAKPTEPYVPDGWRHVPSSDGAGVLAPGALFHPTYEHVMSDRPETYAIVEAAGRVADDFPATALWLLRECYWRNWATSVDDANMLCRAMMDSYRSLGRPSLVAVVASRISISH